MPEADNANIETIPLWDEDEYAADDAFQPHMELHRLETDKPLGAVLVCPGGGYSHRAPHEGAPIARRFNEMRLHAFVVHYSVSPKRHPRPIRDVSRAMRLIRHNAEAWQVSPDHVAVLGFSAGGHLAGSLAVHFEKDFCRGDRPLDQVSNRPDALVMCYAVVSSGEHTHRGAFNNLLGEDATQEMRDFMSLDRQVTEKTPPAFLWHTFEDAGVPVENALLFAQALRRHGTPFELHVYPKGRHGLGLSADDPHVASWSSLCGQWLADMGWPTA